MVKKDKKNDLSKKIMKDIKSQDVKMHSKLYFRLLSWALVASASIFIMLSAITGLIAYRQINYGRGLDLAEFGTRGNTEFIVALPWMAIVSGALTFVATYILIKHFDLSYRYRLYIVIAALVVAVAGLSIVFANTGLANKASELAPFRGLHTFNEFSDEHRLVGEIVGSEEGSFTLSTDEGEITVYPEEEMRGRVFNYEIGDTVTVFGNEQEDGFKAYGIRPGDRQPPPQVQGMKNRNGNGFLK